MNQANRILAVLMAPFVILIGFGLLLAAQRPVVMRDTANVLTGEQHRILISHLGRGEICDPLPCWAEVTIESNTRPTEAVDLPAALGPFFGSERLRVTGSCLPGDDLVRARIRDRWWNRYVPFSSQRWPEEVSFALCLKTGSIR